ncbi:MAG: hypothetical protein EPN49_14270 [Rhodanobacter sp.]|nr:MAG: hypothetical protein EPN49_14270 [Rhodanobacter sp.]
MRFKFLPSSVDGLAVRGPAARALELLATRIDTPLAFAGHRIRRAWSDAADTGSENHAAAQ